jgi:hypothetical protein
MLTDRTRAQHEALQPPGAARPPRRSRKHMRPMLASKARSRRESDSATCGVRGTWVSRRPMCIISRPRQRSIYSGSLRGLPRRHVPRPDSRPFMPWRWQDHNLQAPQMNLPAVPCPGGTPQGSRQSFVHQHVYSSKLKLSHLASDNTDIDIDPTYDAGEHPQY